MLGNKRIDLALQAQPEVAVLGAPEGLGEPGPEGNDVGVVHTCTHPHENQRTHGGEGCLQALGGGIPQHRVIGADAEHHRGRLVPVAVDVNDLGLPAPDRPLHLGAVSPADLPPAGARALDQVVVVGGGHGDAEAEQGFGYRRVHQRERSHRLVEPPPVLTAFATPEAVRHLLRRGKEAGDVANADKAARGARPPWGQARDVVLAERHAGFQQPQPSRLGVPPAGGCGHTRARHHDRVASGDLVAQILLEPPHAMRLPVPRYEPWEARCFRPNAGPAASRIQS